MDAKDWKTFQLGESNSGHSRQHQAVEMQAMYVNWRGNRSSASEEVYRGILLTAERHVRVIFEMTLLSLAETSDVCLKYCTVNWDPFIAWKMFFFAKLKQIYEKEQLRGLKVDI